MNRLNISIAVALFFGLIIAFFSQSARLLKQLEAQGVQIQYAQGSPLTGRAFIRIQNQWQPLWVDLNWRWCPGLNPASWCADATADIGEANGRLALGLSSLRLTDAQLSGNNISLLLGGLVETKATVEANIKKLLLQQGQTLDTIKALDATVLVSKINAMGFDFSAHRIHTKRQAEQDIKLTIEGAEANGTVTAASNGAYHVKLLLTPGPQLRPLLKFQLPEISTGTFELERSGTIKEIR